ncbi:hypothetical protein ABIB25_001488 [Nakamurella sp. UYEF19]|uniref:hypothetical protein n=1 Tax=Nakamurella sp. UYEF19 TaxID=1756392 RepID=UPI003396BA83
MPPKSASEVAVLESPGVPLALEEPGAVLEPGAALLAALLGAALLAEGALDEATLGALAAAGLELLEVVGAVAVVLLEPQALAVRASTARPAMTPVRLKALRVVTTRTSSSLRT